jgi:RNA polymerase subunit RPABC4/transcription elongation factor Spt4
MAGMFCVKCGGRLPEGAAFCPGCGKRPTAAREEGAAAVGGRKGKDKPFCAECGRQWLDGSDFCPGCGTRRPKRRGAGSLAAVAAAVAALMAVSAAAGHSAGLGASGVPFYYEGFAAGNDRGYRAGYNAGARAENAEWARFLQARLFEERRAGLLGEDDWAALSKQARRPAEAATAVAWGQYPLVSRMPGYKLYESTVERYRAVPANDLPAGRWADE